MSKARAPGDWLVRVTAWGRQSVSEGAGPRTAENVHEIDVVGGPAQATELLAEATRWQRARHPALLPMVHASVAADGRSARLCWKAPQGSTLQELSERHGAMSELLVAALSVDLAAAVVLVHARDLVVGRLSWCNLFLAPPGSDGLSAVRVLDAGLPALIAHAGHEVGGSQDRTFALLYEEPAFVAPEVAQGRVPGPAADTFSLCATLASLLLGRRLFEGGNTLLLLHAIEAGVADDLADELRTLAPTLAPALLAGLSPQPLARSGALSDLRTAIADRLGDAGLATVSIVRGGGPWRMGSPVIALAAWAGAGAFADRFGRVSERNAGARPAIAWASAPSEGKSDALGDASAHRPPTATGRSTDGVVDALQRAKLESAMRQLDMQRALTDRERVKPRRLTLDIVVLLVTAAVAAAMVWMATRQVDPVVRTAPGTAHAPIPQTEKPRPPPRRSPLPVLPSRRDR